MWLCTTSFNSQHFMYLWDVHVNPSEHEDSVVPLEKDEHQQACQCQMWTGSVHTAHNGSRRNAMGLATIYASVRPTVHTDKGSRCRWYVMRRLQQTLWTTQAHRPIQTRFPARALNPTHLWPINDEHSGSEALLLLKLVSPAMYHGVTTLNHPTIASAPNDCPGAGHTAYEELLGPANLPSQLDEGEIWIEYHPASGKHPEILRPQGLVQCVVPPVMPYDATTPPWHPFRTRADFEQAELFLRYDCTDSYINGQLKLIHSSSPLGHNITLESSKEMHATLAQIPRIEHLPGVRILNCMDHFLD